MKGFIMFINSIAILFFCFFISESLIFSQDASVINANDTSIESSHNKDATTYISFRKTKNKFDIIYKTSNDSIIALIQDINKTDVSFTNPLNNLSNKISIKEIKKIKYWDGRIELMSGKNKIDKKNTNKELSSKKSSQGDANILVFYSPDSILNMIEKGDVNLKYIGDNLNTQNELLLKKVIFLAKKKTLSNGGDCLLILNTKVYIEYGEIPYIELIGKAYKKPGH